MVSMGTGYLLGSMAPAAPREAETTPSILSAIVGGCGGGNLGQEGEVVVELYAAASASEVDTVVCARSCGTWRASTWLALRLWVEVRVSILNAYRTHLALDKIEHPTTDFFYALRVLEDYNIFRTSVLIIRQ